MIPALPPAAVAAGDATTASAGGRVLSAGGSAADAAVAAALTACAAETVLTGLAGGGFATYWDSVARRSTTVDFFVAVPGLGLDRPVAPMREIEVVFGPQRLEYWAGAATVAVPGLPAGLAEVHRRWGVLPWAEVVEPARTVAAVGAPMSTAQATVLVDVKEAMLLDPAGAASYAPGGRLLAPGERLHHPGLADALDLLVAEGAGAFYSGPAAEIMLRLVAERGGALTADDLASYEVRVAAARQVDFAGYRVHGRSDLLDLLGTLGRLPADLGEVDDVRRVEAWVRALLGSQHPWGTTNVCAVDEAGNACVVTTSLGLGSGDWLPGLGMHLNSMLGEGELMRGSHPPGSRVDSMMCPVVATDAVGLALAAGAAGGSRIRSAMVQVLTGVLAEGLTPAEAVERARINPVPGLVHAEPGAPEPALEALELAGLRVERWESQAAYFGGVSVVGRHGIAADPRRAGAAVLA
ncbi:MAG TPA: gamma-glutamyltransferase [Jiangellales bacterium]|nr:gamma-glutamyltransferase [Jiangellales bacterium]